MELRSYKRYLKVLAIVVVAFYSALIGFNYLVDPFGRNNLLSLDINREDVTRPYNDSLYSLSLAEGGNYTKAVFGDSRARNMKKKFFDSREEGWINFGIGIANMREISSAVKYAVEEEGIEEVLIVISFGTFMDMYMDMDTNRFVDAKNLFDNEFFYYTSTLVTKASYASLVYIFTGKVLKERSVRKSKEKFWAKRLAGAHKSIDDWSPTTGVLPEIEGLFKFLDERGVRYTVRIPITHEDIVDAYASGLEGHYEAYKNFLISRAPVMDCSSADIKGDYDSFRDPFHVETKIFDMIVGEYLSESEGLCRFVGKERN